MATKKTSSSIAKKVAVGAGVVALSGAAYLLFGPEGKKHQKDLKNWMQKNINKKEVAKEIESLKNHLQAMTTAATKPATKAAKKARA